LGQSDTALIGDILERVPIRIFESDACRASSDHDGTSLDQLGFRLPIPAPYPKHSIKGRELADQIVELPNGFRWITDAIFGRGRNQVIENDLPMIASLAQDETLLKKSGPALRV
jgi:hypothetical protein